MKVWITKYALTSGVMVKESDESACVVDGVKILDANKHTAYYFGQDWHTTPESAAARVKELIYAKARSVSKQLGKLNELERLLNAGELPGLECVKC